MFTLYKVQFVKCVHRTIPALCILLSSIWQKNFKKYKNKKNLEKCILIAPIWQKKLCKMQKIKIIWKNNFDCLSKFLTVVCNFLQCDYCQIGNVSMNFSSPLVTENSFQITRLRLVIWKEFSVTCGEEKPILTFPPDSNLSLLRPEKIVGECCNATHSVIFR